jgi:hypothetical protein
LNIIGLQSRNICETTAISPSILSKQTCQRRWRLCSSVPSESGPNVPLDVHLLVGFGDNWCTEASAEVQLNQIQVPQTHSGAHSSCYGPIDSGDRYVAKFIILKNFTSLSFLVN